MATREKPRGARQVAGAERAPRHGAAKDGERAAPEPARQPGALQPLEPPEGKDPPARRGEDDQGRPVGA